MRCILALDQGTTSSRAIVFDEAGGIRGSAQQEFRQIFPQPGWVEHDATEIWATQSGVMHEALAKAGVTARDVAAIGITNQRETTVVWERVTGRPIANAIVWQDRRTAPLCDELRASGKATLIGEKTGLVIDAYFSGTKLKWLRDGLQIIRSASDVEPLAASVEDSGGVYFVPAFAGLGAPHWDAYARGSVFGLTRGTTGGHLARAALESIAFQSADVLDAMQKDAGITLSELRVDGGATANDLLMQFQADVLGVPVVRPKVLETTALGAAYLAGLAVGYWKSDADVTSNWRVDRRFEPAMSRERVAEMRRGWQKAVERAKGWVDRA
jgi:glycerol kinase